MGAHCEALGADAEYLAFKDVPHQRSIQLLFENTIQGFPQMLPVQQSIGRHIFETVRHPDVVDAGGAQFPTHIGRDFPRTLARLYPITRTSGAGRPGKTRPPSWDA